MTIDYSFKSVTKEDRGSQSKTDRQDVDVLRRGLIPSFPHTRLFFFQRLQTPLLAKQKVLAVAAEQQQY